MNSRIMSALPHWISSSSSVNNSRNIFQQTFFSSLHPSTTIFGTIFEAPCEPKKPKQADDNVDAPAPLDTSGMDINRQPLMGLHGYDFNRILLCSKKGYWHHKTLLESQYTNGTMFYEVITLDVGESYTGVSLWNQGRQTTLAHHTFKTSNMRSELRKLTQDYRPYGFVIGYPVGPDGGTTPEHFNQSHVNQFLFNLDSFPEFKGVPICLVNEFGTSQNLEEKVNAALRSDMNNQAVFNDGEVPRPQYHRNRFAAEKQMRRFIKTVAPELLPPSQKIV